MPDSTVQSAKQKLFSVQLTMHRGENSDRSFYSGQSKYWRKMNENVQIIKEFMFKHDLMLHEHYFIEHKTQKYITVRIDPSLGMDFVLTQLLMQWPHLGLESNL